MAGERPELPPRLPPRPSVPLPPSPLARERLADPAAVPLPWTTPLVTSVAGTLAGGAAVLAWVTANHDIEGWHLVFATFVWYGMTVGVGATVMDHVAPSWPPMGRWAMGMGLAAAPPPPALIFEMVGQGSWDGSVLIVCGVVASVVFAAFGVVLGLARRATEGWLWKLPLAGVGFGLGVPLGLIGVALVMSRPASIFSGFPVELLAFVGVLGLSGGLAGGALAERLYRAFRRPAVTQEGENDDV